ncbi:bifunctional indole-3-glycerol-phosphate synthase TrpC/phosphoribosylanthranilate isomerase TrpF [Blochmannia endosymbiont of Colobopsis nipponica]|uniref:bifunctional indole-3-glycerol-phosphate synthase TrpC/phosphoribosylanthranilate isomerase TrpF n=1 Tax=Blochmannia endosymbiont of Colobopsis nipponica TaxID=2681987 RepID=UPI00177B14F7|nr:bifunctional indole-3-glycerol-phosphate synthase TrpC/phosphoribosylanthranilate isomerase TrpF [Blochmannia endosymbiont of Colobopsis nipponica]QOI11028.1 bifunctional indole-3-glycerol-phosphate synthase TrpC/phosphoribosylanthranilate isomerase TrpF [Blochmannia endosymbiont of Colobopsis nipponica]
MSNYTLLKEIVENRKSWVAIQEKKRPLNKITKQLELSNRNFYHALSKPHTTFILECKKATPTKGIIQKKFNLDKIAKVYKKYASVISVLTEEKYFHGNFNFLDKISKIVTQPILCKDFIVSPWQIFFARLCQADAILLMLSILNDNDYKKLAQIAHNLNMGILTEVINEEEWERAIILKAKVIGINNRNLHDMSIDLNRTINISQKNKNGVILISESGIKNHLQIRKLSPYVNGFLIGSVLMSATNLDIATRRLLLGENKVCGLTRIIDANAAYKAGALYGGLIFVDKSPRHIDIFTAKTITQSKIAPLLYVGVFCNDLLLNIIKIASILKLYAIQLHGKEDQNYINLLHRKLPKYCQIWKAFNMNQTIKIKKLNKVSRYLLDSTGGSGKIFDWKLINKMKLNNVILAGGLQENNCTAAINLGCAGLDLNSGIELKPGIKDHEKLRKIFQIIRLF